MKLFALLPQWFARLIHWSNHRPSPNPLEDPLLRNGISFGYMFPHDDQNNLERQDPPEQKINTKDGEPFEVLAKGSLSLLALGYRGLLAWRAKRTELAGERPAAIPKGDGQA